MPGEGKLPLRAVIAALPQDIPLAPSCRTRRARTGTSAHAWAKITLESTRNFLQG